MKKFVHCLIAITILFSMVSMVSAESIQNDSDMAKVYESEPNQFMETANTIHLDEAMFGSLGGLDLDYYKITIPAYGNYTLVGSASGSSIDLGFGIMKADKLVIEPYDWGYLDDEEEAEYNSYELAEGTYYIACLDFNDLRPSGSYFIFMVDNATLDEDEETMAPIVNPVDDNDKVITGKAAIGSRVYVQINKKPIPKNGIPVDSKGKFSVPISVQKAGASIEVYLIDSNGYGSDITKVTVVDKTPPKTLTVSKLTVKSKTITGKTEPNAIIKVMYTSINMGTAKADSKGNYKVTLKSTPRKDRIYKVTATDKAGNAKTVKTKVLAK